MKPAVRFSPSTRRTETGRLIVVEVSRFTISAATYLVRQGYDYAKKCHWWI